MFRFNEGDITDDAAAYLLAIKESVSGILEIIITRGFKHFYVVATYTI